MSASRLFNWVLIPLIATMAASCATAVIFDVEHPPLVDLRGADTITVIPFEWNSIIAYNYLASCVTAALLSGLRWGSIDIVDPYTLENARGRNYRQFADVYITGRIINIDTYEQIDTNKSEVYSTPMIIREFIIGTVVVDIEYSYIRSADNKMLGNFRKRDVTSTSFERSTRYRDQNADRNAGRNTNRNTYRDTYRDTYREAGRRGRAQGAAHSAFPQRGTWQEGAAASAIARFSDTMKHELSPWTTIENRNIKGRTGDNTLAAEAKNYIEQNRYDEALARYKTIYEQNGNIFAGYNAAVLLAANEQFADALGLLERLRDRRLKEGKSVPAFIKNEIKKVAEFVNSSKILETYPPAFVPAATSTTATTAAAGREIAGTVNLNPAMLYALNGTVSSIDDNSIFAKMVAFADADNGQWSMRLPDTAPAALWLLVTDGRREHYITKTAINVSGAVTLNTVEMTKLN